MSFTKLMLFAAAISYGPSNVDVPDTVQRPPVQQVGVATWYGDGNWHGAITANGETFRPYKETTCAHRDLPFGTIVLVEHIETGNQVWCRINDRGPYMTKTNGGPREFNPPGEPLSEGEHWHGVLDMSTLTAKKLGTYKEGVPTVRLYYRRPRSSFRVADWADG